MCFGVGCDNVNVEACTCNDVMLAITPDGVSAIALLMALSHKLLIKDRLTPSQQGDTNIDAMVADESGHFEMVTPTTSTWAVVRNAFEGTLADLTNL